MPEMVILSPDVQTLDLDRARFETAVEEYFGTSAKFSHLTDAESPYDVVARIERPGEPSFQVFRFRTDAALATDGTPEQAAEVALWVRSLLQDDPGGRIWLVDEGYNGHVQLEPGMTAEAIRANWVDHAEIAPDDQPRGRP
jgi:hypothetical protein